MKQIRFRVAVFVALMGLPLLAAGCSREDAFESTRSSAALVADDEGDPPEPRRADSDPGNRNRWPFAGHDLLNTRNQDSERRVGRNNASTLVPKWIFTSEGDIWATPAVADDVLYVPDAAGNLFAIDRRSGSVRWQRKVGEYTGVANDLSRNTPAVVGDSLILGGQGGRFGAGASVFAVKRSSGELLWTTKVEEHIAAVITQSPVVSGDSVFVGVSSLEEQYAATTPGYPCCSFRGSMLALNKNDGRILWKTSTLPAADVAGYSGGSVWGNTAVIDTRRNTVYITTGNNYTVPKEILECQLLGTPELAKACVDGVPHANENHFDAIIALDMKTGAIRWAHSMVPFDSWNISCVFRVMGNEGNCTNPHGEDFDFGQGATLFSVRTRGRDERGAERQLLGAGQKSGVYWALNPDDGSVVWSTQVGPGGSLGGLEWGSAIDGQRIYVAIANNQGKPWTLSDGTMTTSGFWSALEPATGQILWTSAGNPPVKSSNQGPVTVANGVVYAGTIDTAGTMYALDASNGATLWTFASGGSVNSGPAIVDGTLYWGSGYGVRGIGLKPNNKLYAFVPKADCRGRNSCVPSAGTGGAGGAAGGGGAGAPAAGSGGSSGPIPSTWSGIYAAYLGPGTIGHCSGCHNGMAGRIVPLNSAAVAYQSLQSVGQINGVDSPLGKRGLSRVTWLGGDMPPNGPTSAPDAEQAIQAWVAAGALNN